MKPALQLRTTQQLSLTPQLKQAIKLLSLSALELQDEVRALAEANPLLELDAAAESDGEYASGEVATLRAESAGPVGEDSERAEAGEGEADNGEALDSDGEQPEWHEASSGDRSDSDDDTRFERDSQREPSLREHLAWQIELTPFTERDRRIAWAIVDALDADGYLREDDAALAMAADLPDLDGDEIEAVRRRVQRFDPLGVASRSLQECLLAQLGAVEGGMTSLAACLVREHLEALARGDRSRLAKRLACTEDELNAAIELIRGLDPKPGRRFESSPTEYVVPDVYVFRRGNRLEVSLNPAGSVQLKLSSHYLELLKRASRSDAQYLKGQMQEARWLIKSLEQRNDTVLKVARAIVEHQREFFEHGPERMRPLVLREIASEVGLHESTISRVTMRKYMHTPRGLFEFKHFFTSHVATAAGGEASAVAIQALIKRLIDGECKTAPLSDNALALALKAQGYLVARRTVAKYRELLGIASSTDRARRA